MQVENDYDREVYNGDLSIVQRIDLYMMLARNLLYTGVTRGKRLVVLVGQRKALAIAVRNQGARLRWAKLRGHLAAIRSGYPINSGEALRGPHPLA